MPESRDQEIAESRDQEMPESIDQHKYIIYLYKFNILHSLSETSARHSFALCVLLVNYLYTKGALISPHILRVSNFHTMQGPFCHDFHQAG